MAQYEGHQQRRNEERDVASLNVYLSLGRYSIWLVVGVKRPPLTRALSTQGTRDWVRDAFVASRFTVRVIIQVWFCLFILHFL